MRAANLDESVFDDLSEVGGEDLISTFIPTHRKGREVAEDRIHLKNQLSAAEEALADIGYKPREREARLSRARELLGDLEFWEHQDEGLAVFVDEDGAVIPVSSSRKLTPAAFVLPVFVLRPLAADIDPLSAPVLVLTKDSVALFAVSRSSAEPMDAELPSYGDVNWFVDRETQRQQHPDHVGTSRSRHGHEATTRDDEDLSRFLREVDTALDERFDPDASLIVLGDDGVVARFANVSRRKTVSPPNSGITAPFSTQEVRDRAGVVIADLEQGRLDDAVAGAGDQLGLGMGTTDLEDALTAVVSGRVGRVIIDTSAAPVWGRFDRASFEVEVHPSMQPGDVDLLDRLVVWGRQNGAEVVATESAVEGRTFIAVYRY